MKKHIRNFKDQQNICKHLFCPICHEVFKKPVLITCGHTFCKHCIQLWRVNHKECPSCRQAIDRKDNLLKNLVPQQIIDELEVNCACEDCNWSGQLQDLNKHYTQCKSFLEINKPAIQEDKAITIEEEVLVDDTSDVEIVEVKNLKIKTLGQKNFNQSQKIGIKKTIQKPKQNNNLPKVVSLKEQIKQQKRINRQNSSSDISQDEQYSDNLEELEQNDSLDEMVLEENYDDYDNESDVINNLPNQDSNRKCKKTKQGKVMKKINISYQNQEDSYGSLMHKNEMNEIKNFIEEFNEENQTENQKQINKQQKSDIEEDSIKNVDDMFDQEKRHKSSYDQNSNSIFSSNKKQNGIHENELKEQAELDAQSPAIKLYQTNSAFNMFNSIKQDIQEEQYSLYLSKFSSLKDKDKQPSTSTIIEQQNSSIERKNIIINESNMILSDQIPQFNYGSPSQNKMYQMNKLIEDHHQQENQKSAQKSDDYISSCNKISSKMDIEQEINVEKCLSPQKEIDILRINKSPQEKQNKIHQFENVQNAGDNQNNHLKQVQSQNIIEQNGENKIKEAGFDDEQEEEESKCDRAIHKQGHEINYQLQNIDYKKFKGEENNSNNNKNNESNDKQNILQKDQIEHYIEKKFDKNEDQNVEANNNNDDEDDNNNKSKNKNINENDKNNNDNDKSNNDNDKSNNDNNKVDDNIKNNDIINNNLEQIQQKKKNPIIDILFGFWKS